MADLLKYSLNIQLFNEGGDGGNPNPPIDTPPNTEIDYEKLADVVSKREQAAGDAALKGYLKSQGLSKEECDSAIAAYKQTKVDKKKEEEENYQRIIKENEAYKKAEALKIIQDNAKAVAKELNVRDDRFDKLFKLSDTSKFTKEDGSVDKEAIKTEFEKQLKDLPEFTQKKQIVISASSNSYVKPHEITDAEEYRKQKYGKSKYFRG